MVDVDPLAGLFGAPDPLTLLVSFAFFFGIIYMGLKKKETPLYLALLNFLMVLTLYVGLGIASPYYAVLLVFVASFMVQNFVSKQFLGNMGSESRIFLSYVIFFSVAVFFLGMAQSSLYMSAQDFGPPKMQAFTAYGDIVQWTMYVFNLGISYASWFFRFFLMDSPIDIVNVALIIPFMYFIVKYLADWIRARGSA